MGLELSASYEIGSLGLTPYATAAYLKREPTNTIDMVFRFRPARRKKFTNSHTGTQPWAGRLGARWEKDLDNFYVFQTDVYVEWASKAKETLYSDSLHDVNGTGNLADLDYGFAATQTSGLADF
jgi:hypothetical protein